jgi:TM2 domain-containing membrane protein YozV/TolB-like protein
MLAWPFVLLSLALDVSPAPQLQATEVVATPTIDVLDEGKALAALQALPLTNDVASLAVVVAGSSPAERRAVSRALLRAARRMGVPAGAASADKPRVDADHALEVRIDGDASASVAQLLLVRIAGGEVRGRGQINLYGAADTITPSLAAAAADVVDDAAIIVEEAGYLTLLYPIAIMPSTDEFPGSSAVLRSWQNSLSQAAARRGFTVVDRSVVDDALRKSADPQRVGQLSVARAVVLTNLVPVADALQVNVRWVDVESGAVIAANTTTVPREGVVTLAQVEQRSPADAAFSSAVVPGWGQMQNGQVGKGIGFAVLCSLGLASTVGLGVGTALAAQRYDAAADPIIAKDSRGLANGLLAGAVAAGSVTGICWGVNVFDALVSAPKPRQPEDP